jgi:thioesterase domain-containing protein
VNAHVGEIDILPNATAAEIWPVREVVADIWRRVLGPKARDSGLHILRATIGVLRLARFQKEIAGALGVTLPLTALMRLGTVDAIAAAIESGIVPDPSPLVLLRDGQEDLPLYVISAGGPILELCDLAQLIEFPGQIWGVQLPGLDGEAEPLRCIHAIAGHYLDAILARRPPATFHMVGYSFGGLVAVEMARRLLAAGRPVGLVGLLDSTCYEKYWPRSEWIRFAFRRARQRIGEVRELSPGMAWRHLAGRFGALIKHVRRRFDRPAAQGTSNQSKYYIGGLEPDLQRMRDASIIAFEAYEPTPIECRITLFKSLLGDPRACDPVGIWRRLASDLEVVVVPGSHVTMIRKPFASRLAAEISRRIR